MEVLTYSDLFATKGSEYLLVLAFLAILIVFWRILSRSTPLERATLGHHSHAAWAPWFQVADHVSYHQGHTWAAPDSENTYTIGIDDFAQRLVGRPSAVELPRPGTRLRQGELAWNLRVDQDLVPQVSPLEGEVVAVNEAVLKSPQLINEDPYGKGWLLKVSSPQGPSSFRNLLRGRLVSTWMDETMAMLRNRLPAPAGAALQDGGEPVSGFGRALDADHWPEIAADFFLTGTAQPRAR